MKGILVGLTLLTSMGGLLPPREVAPPRFQPAAEAQTAPIVTPAPTRSLDGRASWYRYHQGQAAAGPRLRKMLGSDWRHQQVRVCQGGDCVIVTLTDWCQCYRGEKRERVIDLDSRDFAALAPTGDGLTKVSISAE